MEKNDGIKKQYHCKNFEKIFYLQINIFDFDVTILKAISHLILFEDL